MAPPGLGALGGPEKGARDCAMAFAATVPTPAAARPEMSLRLEMPASRYCLIKPFMALLPDLSALALRRGGFFLVAQPGLEGRVKSYLKGSRHAGDPVVCPTQSRTGRREE